MRAEEILKVEASCRAEEAIITQAKATDEPQPVPVADDQEVILSASFF